MAAATATGASRRRIGPWPRSAPEPRVCRWGTVADGVSHAINYDLPNVPESYVHRIGRRDARETTDARFPCATATVGSSSEPADASPSTLPSERVPRRELSTPVTMVFKIAMGHSDDLRWVSRLLGTSPRRGTLSSCPLRGSLAPRENPGTQTPSDAPCHRAFGGPRRPTPQASSFAGGGGTQRAHFRRPRSRHRVLRHQRLQLRHPCGGRRGHSPLHAASAEDCAPGPAPSGKS